MTTDDQDRLDKRVFDFIVSRGVSWVFAADIAKQFDAEDAGYALGRLVDERLIERWQECPKGPAWALTPYAAATLGFELDKTGKKWIRADAKKTRILIPVEEFRSTKRYRSVEIGKSSLYSIERHKPIDRRPGKNPVAFEHEVGEFDEMFAGTEDNPADFLEAYEEIVGNPESIEPEPPRKNGHSNRDYSDRPIPPPRHFLGGDDPWPLAGQKREDGPPEGQPGKSDVCGGCHGKIKPGGASTYCLSCGAFSYDFLIPTLELFRDGRLLWQAINQRKRRKAARAEARRVKRPVGRPRKNPPEGK